jgi:hypothetical protein
MKKPFPEETQITDEYKKRYSNSLVIKECRRNSNKIARNRKHKG